MKTTFVIEPTSLVSMRLANTACSTISAAVRCLFKPILQCWWRHYKTNNQGGLERSSVSEWKKENKSLPSGVTELTIHGTSHLTWNTNSVTTTVRRYEDSLDHRPIYQHEQNLQPSVSPTINENIHKKCMLLHQSTYALLVVFNIRQFWSTNKQHKQEKILKDIY